MTVETTTRKATFAGGQGSLTFSFRTLTSNPEYIKVNTQVVATLVEAALTYGVDYTVSVNSDGVGGVVTVLPTHSTAYNYVVYRDTGALQATDFDDYNNFPADTLETVADRGIMIAQEIKEDLTRALRYPIGASGASTELPTPSASAFLRWNSAATALENAAIPDPSVLVKANASQAAAGSDNDTFMTPSMTNIAIAALIPIASQAQAIASTSNTVAMSPYRVRQLVESSGTLAIPSGNISTGTGANMVLKLDASSRIPPVNGSLLTSVGGANIMQVRKTIVTSSGTTTTTIPFDDTIPQNTEGAEFMTCAITPTSTASTLKIDVVVHGAFSGTDGNWLIAALFQDTTADALATGAHTVFGTSFGGQVKFTHVMSAGTTSATTFKVRAGMSAAGTLTFNGSAGSRVFGGTCASSIVVTEIR
jgi:hypothetical protein